LYEQAIRSARENSFVHNEAFANELAARFYLRIIGYDRGDLVAGRLNWRDLTPPEWRGADDRRTAQLHTHLDSAGDLTIYEISPLRESVGQDHGEISSFFETPRIPKRQSVHDVIAVPRRESS
jgi:hypothetical protein